MNAPAAVDVASVEFEVTITVLTPLTQMSAETHDQAVALIERARQAAETVLAGGPGPVPASLAAAIALVIRHHESARDHSAPTDIAGVEARLALDAALNTLKTRFEEEFPNGSD